MKEMENTHKYLISSDRDLNWGIVVNTVGKAVIQSGYTMYPPDNGHPEEFYFNLRKGRVLETYQLLYIAYGQGSYYTTKEQKIDIKAGDILILKPGVWHSYSPDKKTGWHEYWIGFHGRNIDSRFTNNFFDSEQVLYHIGLRDDVVELYEQAIRVARSERVAHQQYLAGIANLLLGMTMYYDRNQYFAESNLIEQINQAKIIMHEKILNPVTPEEIAQEVNMSYSWFRKKFKEYTGFSPAQYIIELRIQRAKKLLANTDMSIKEIAYYLNFDNLSYFSQIFKKQAGYTPVSYRRTFRVDKKGNIEN